MKAQRVTSVRNAANWFRWVAGLSLPVFVLAVSAPGQQAEKEDNDAPKPTAAQRRQSINNLKQIALGMHSYGDAFRQLPATAHIDPNVRRQLGNVQLTTEQLAKAKLENKRPPLPLLSWRVALLPFLEENDLYRQFKLDEPWDSEHNKKLIAKMPRVYAPAFGKTKEPGLTYYQVFVGPDAPFNGTIGPRLTSFTDGLSNTFLVVEAGPAVPWTAPQDVRYDAGKALPRLGGHFPDGFYAAMGDGAVRFVPRDANEKAIRATITPSGGEVVEAPGQPVKRND